MWHLKPALLTGATIFSAFALLVGKSNGVSGGNGGGLFVNKTAVVNPATGGMNARVAPRLDAAFVENNDAWPGTTVQVLQTGIVPEDGSGGEWWKIVTPGGSTGYARAVDPKGVHNFQVQA